MTHSESRTEAQTEKNSDGRAPEEDMLCKVAREAYEAFAAVTPGSAVKEGFPSLTERPNELAIKRAESVTVGGSPAQKAAFNKACEALLRDHPNHGDASSKDVLAQDHKKCGDELFGQRDYEAADRQYRAALKDIQAAVTRSDANPLDKLISKYNPLCNPSPETGTLETLGRDWQRLKRLAGGEQELKLSEFEKQLKRLTSQAEPNDAWRQQVLELSKSYEVFLLGTCRIPEAGIMSGPRQEDFTRRMRAVNSILGPRK